MPLVRSKIRTRNKFNPKLYIAVDTETTGTDIFGEDAPFAVSMCDEEGNTWYCEWPVNPYTREVYPDLDDVEFIRYYCSERFENIFHHAKFDVAMLAKHGIKVKGKVHCTLIQARVVYTLEFDYGLKYLSNRYLDIPATDEHDLQEGVVSARRIVQSRNRKASEENRFKLHADVGGDYWLPRHLDPANRLCETYCIMDSLRAMGLFMMYSDVMSDDKALKQTYYKEMFKIWPIVNKMEKRGVKCYPDAVREELEICRKALNQHFSNMLGIIADKALLPFDPDKYKGKDFPEFNPGSSDQLRRVLFLPEGEGGLGLSTDRKSKKTGSMSTGKDTLEELMYSPFVQELSGWKAAQQALSLFFEKFEITMVSDAIEPGAMMIHPGFNQAGTKTLRFSGGGKSRRKGGAGINMQQISDPEKSLSSIYNARKVFGPRKGYVWLCWDYSQQEVRIFAYIGNIPVMLDAIYNDTDTFEAIANHAWGGKGNPNATKAAVIALDLFKEPSNEQVEAYWSDIGWTQKKARLLTPTAPEVVTLADEWLSDYAYDIVAAEKGVDKKSSRQRSKHITYANIYGGGPKSFTHLLKCSLDEAKLFAQEYHSKMPEVRKAIQECEKEARLNKKFNGDFYIETLYGNKLRVDPDFFYRGINYKVQGTGAQMMKDAMVKLDKFFVITHSDAHIVLTVHDELIIEAHESLIKPGFLKAIKNRMEDTGGRIGVPMPVECNLIRHQWGTPGEKIKFDYAV